MLRPVDAADFVANEPIGGCIVRHPQQRFREAHQGHAFFGRKAVLLEEDIDAAGRPAAGANALDQAGGGIPDPPPRRTRKRCVIDQCLQTRRLAGMSGGFDPLSR